MVSMNELKQDMIIGMGYIGLDSDRLYRMRRGPKLIDAVASGSTIIINDATEGRPFRGLRVFGKSTQVRTTGAQLFDAKTCLKSQIEKGVVSINSDGRIVLKGVIDANNRAFTVTLQPGTYTLSADKPSIWHIIAPVDGVFNQKITADVETTYNCYIANGTYDNVETTPMINAGLSALPWEPYTGGKPSPSPEYPQEIVNAGEGGSIAVGVTGKNFATIDVDEYLKAGWQGGIEPINNGIKIIAINGWHMELLYIPFLAGKEITVSFTYRQIPEETSSQDTNNAFCFINTNVYPNNSKDIKFKINSPSIDSTKVSCSFVARSAYLGFFIRLDKEGSDFGLKRTIEITNFQIELGNKETPYEPYTHQSLTLQTPNGLPGVPVSKDGNYTDADGQQWVCDEIDLERGKYVQRIETRILDGTEAWKHRITNSGNNNFQILINDRPSSAIHRSFCNYLPYKNFIWDDNIVNLPKIYSYDLEITASFPPESEFKSVEIWNSWLKEKGDFKFQYVLATPIERDLTPEEIAAYKALRTYGPTTVITNDAGAGMEVTYVADRKEN